VQLCATAFGNRLTPREVWNVHARLPEFVLVHYGRHKPAEYSIRLGPPGNSPAERTGGPVAGMQYRLRMEGSPDLKTWSPAGELAPGTNVAFRLSLNPGAPYRFFRLNASLEDTTAEPETAEMFGSGRIYREELLRSGFLTPEQFAAQHAPSTNYLSTITFDPQSAKFWDAFNANPAVYNASLPPGGDRRPYDFRMTPRELALFQKNGFVVTERLGAPVSPSCSTASSTTTCRFFSPPMPRCTPGITRINGCCRNWRKPS
jgi:hypothetical protein